MIVIFGKPYLKLLFTTGTATEKKHRFQPDIIKRYIKVVNTMIAVKDIGDLSRINSLRYEKLAADRIIKPLQIRLDMIDISGVDPTMIANNTSPAQATHPGEIILDEIEHLGISQKDFAERIGVSRSLVSQVLAGKRAVSTEFALLAEAAIDLPADLLLRMQARYDRWKVEKEPAFMDRLSKIRKFAAVL